MQTVQPTGCEDLPVVRAEGESQGATVYKSRLIATCLYSPSPGRATGWQSWDTVSPQATAILRRGIFSFEVFSIAIAILKAIK
jgi:hypothetical protein